MIAVGDFIKKLQEFPDDWPVRVQTPAGGAIVIEHREICGRPVVAIFGENGGRFGETPLTEKEYEKQRDDFLKKFGKSGYVYSSDSGNHIIYQDFGGVNDRCFGQRYDVRIVERMMSEGLIDLPKLDVERARYCNRV